MQAIKTLLCVSLFITASTLQAEHGPETSEQQLRTRIARLIDNPDADALSRDARDATIEFVINAQNKIVILEVHTRSPYLERFIKEKVNYRPAKVKGLVKLRPYMLSVTFETG